MAKTWVLDTETKGTGAHIAPLGKAHDARRERALATVTLQRPPRAPKAAEPLEDQRRFKVLDIRSGRLLGEGLDARATIELLAEVQSALDVRIWVWMPSAERWRLLTLSERKTLWDFRGRRAES